MYLTNSRAGSARLQQNIINIHKDGLKTENPGLTSWKMKIKNIN